MKIKIGDVIFWIFIFTLIGIGLYALFRGIYMKLKAEDIVFFIAIGLALFVLLWLLHGSPTLDSALMSIGTFIITSEVLLWRKYFQMDRGMVIGFSKVKNDFDKLNYKLDMELKY